MELTDVTVLRLSLMLGERLEGPTTAGDSLFPDRPLDSHEKLIPSFFGTGSADEDAGSFAFGSGEDPQGIDGRLPDNPLVFGGNLICDEGWSLSGMLSSWLR